MWLTLRTFYSLTTFLTTTHRLSETFKSSSLSCRTWNFLSFQRDTFLPELSLHKSTRLPVLPCKTPLSPCLDDFTLDVLQPPPSVSLPRSTPRHPWYWVESFQLKSPPVTLPNETRHYISTKGNRPRVVTRLRNEFSLQLYFFLLLRRPTGQKSDQRAITCLETLLTCYLENKTSVVTINDYTRMTVLTNYFRRARNNGLFVTQKGFFTYTGIL